jgi:hypothetical protein
VGLAAWLLGCVQGEERPNSMRQSPSAETSTSASGSGLSTPLSSKSEEKLVQRLSRGMYALVSACSLRQRSVPPE